MVWGSRVKLGEKHALKTQLSDRSIHGLDYRRGTVKTVQGFDEVESFASKALGRFSHHRPPKSLQVDLLLRSQRILWESDFQAWSWLEQAVT